MFKTPFSFDKIQKKKKEYSAILQYLQIPCLLAFHEFLLNNLDFRIHERSENVLSRTTGEK